MKRIVLLIATNLAIVVVLGIFSTLTGAHRFFTGSGLDLGKLLLFAAIMGFGGAFISLLLSRTIAKWSTGARVIESPASSTEYWLVDTVRRYSERADVPMPEVAIYEGEANAFATGATRRSSLVAVSTGLLENMTREEAEAVIAHEVAHIANGDMVTLTLIQGVVNTFVVFVARVIGWLVDSALRRQDGEQGPGLAYTVTVVLCDIVFVMLASIIVMYFSRQREFRADAGAAQLMGSPVPMVRALRRLGSLEAGALPQNVATAGISGRPGWLALFASHPPIEERIAALRAA
ncbi:protease HtpX [Accumulibacter sp.]|uniref:protease HtpX n=1 Tax=Accumulibacter sp. TaxID=2053492 RepID=UPI0025E1D301|nr:protease HtpX [Accumulibacter sp.]MCM8595446.1 protease HtpX [Accumulibacter sp.]MDS4049593.1 protease HtpX [Accumulibacter sp.]